MALLEWLTGNRAPAEERSAGSTFGLSDADALAEFLGLGTSSAAGVSVTEGSALGVTAFWRGVNIICGTIAGLPLKTYRRLGDGRERVSSWLDDPSGPYDLTPYAWKELVMYHLLVRSESFLQHLYNGGGALIGLWPIHPSNVSEVKWDGFGKTFKVGQDGQTRTFSSAEMTQIMGLSADGLRGISLLSRMRNALGTGIAGEQAAARSFANGLLIGGLVTPETDLDEEDAKVIKAGLRAKLSGPENAGDIALVNRALKFTPWMQSNEDAQFIESREFQVTEVARILGIPPHLLAQTEKQTSWGSGVAEQNLGLARYTLMGWTSRIEEALNPLLPADQFCEFDYAGLFQGTPKEELELLKLQIDAGILTIDEARAIRNLPPRPDQPPAEEIPAA